MDERSQAQLDRILTLNPDTLSANDKAFLRARSEYLTKAQAEDFKSVLKGDQPVEAPAEESTQDKLAEAKQDRKEAREKETAVLEAQEVQQDLQDPVDDDQPAEEPTTPAQEENQTSDESSEPVNQDGEPQKTN